MVVVLTTTNRQIIHKSQDYTTKDKLIFSTYSLFCQLPERRVVYGDSMVGVFGRATFDGVFMLILAGG